MKRLLQILFIPILLISISCREVIKEAAKGINKAATEKAEEKLFGTYSGVATYVYYYSTVLNGVEDKMTSQNRTIMIVKNGSNTNIIFQNQSIILGGIKLIENGVTFTINQQVISTTDGQSSVQINGMSEIACSDGTKADGLFESDSKKLSYSYGGNQVMVLENGEQITVPYTVTYEMVKN
jgi:hypothetical protein